MNVRPVHQWLIGMTLMQSISVMALDTLPVAYRVVSEATQVPVDILFAIALTESGKHYQGTTLPWPWALNIAGRSVYCLSQTEALIHIQEALRQQKAIDIGVMQISWHWHQQRFTHISEALIPINNLKAGAVILREHFEATEDWWEAVGRYHDPGQDQTSRNNAKRYREKVKQHWEAQFQ